MIGIIKLSTPVVQYELPLESLSNDEIDSKSRLLKEAAAPGEHIPYMVWIQLPSSMNNNTTGFKTR